MDTFRTSGARTPREAPKVGDYRRGSRVRTTKAGTWFPALDAADGPAGLLLLHPAVKPAVLKAAIKRLAELRLPGVLPMLPGLVDQAGRNWLVATASPTPTVADLLDDASYGTPENAVALSAAIAATLLDVHAAGLAHGAVGAHAVVLAPDGGPMLADWGLDEHASPAGDVAAWSEFVELLAERWCADSPVEAAVLARAVNAAGAPGAGGGLSGALTVLTQPDHVQPVHEQPEHSQPEDREPEHVVPEHVAPEHVAPDYAAPAPISVPRPKPRSSPRHAAPEPPAAEPVAPSAPAGPSAPAAPDVPAARAVPVEPAVPAPTPAPSRVQSAALAPPEAQRYVAPPVEPTPIEPTPIEHTPVEPPPVEPGPSPRDVAPRAVPPPPPAPPRPAPRPRPAARPRPPDLTAPLPRVPAPLPLPATTGPLYDDEDTSESAPLPPAADAAPPRSKSGFARPALLTALLTIILVTAVAVIIRPFDTKQQPPSEPSGPMVVRAVSVAGQLRESICVVVGTVTTNGQAGRLVYRWVGENGSQAVSSVSTSGYNYQVEIGLIWAPSSPPLHGTSITLQILEPEPSTTSAVLPVSCI